MLPILGVLSVILLLPVGFGALAVVRRRRFRQALAERDRRGLPPHPVIRH
jgi:hypothetical protein